MSSREAVPARNGALNSAAQRQQRYGGGVSKTLAQFGGSRRATQLQERVTAMQESPLVVAQRAKNAVLFKKKPDEEKKLAQRMVAQRAENRTGLPDGLKAGVESLSGMSMDGVRVHRNSAMPAQMNAHAFAQGSEIHVAPGQEKHLPHEAWHVVQQAQGRVKPTMQMKSGVPVNDDKGLEQEASVMGAKAVSAGTAGTSVNPLQLVSSAVQATVQRARTKQTGRKKRKAPRKVSPIFKGRYITVSVVGGRLKVVSMKRRPTSNSRRGQGDHIVPYALVERSVFSSLSGLTVDDALDNLSILMGSMSNLVKVRSPWLKQAKPTISRIDEMEDVDEKDPETIQEVGQLAENCLVLINQMPGTAAKNTKSTGGHNEAGNVGGLDYIENKKGEKPTDGSTLINLLRLVDLNASTDSKKNPRDYLEKAIILAEHTWPETMDAIKKNRTKCVDGALKSLPELKYLRKLLLELLK